MQELGAVRRALSAGALDEPLVWLTGGEPAAGRQRVEALLDGFQKCFQAGENTPVTLCSAPGRTEICGNHTDHQHGRVLAAAVNLDFLACAAPALVSHARRGRVEWQGVVWCLVLGIPAAIAAGAVAGQLDVGLLRRLFGLLMLYVGIKEVFARKPNEKT